MNYTAKSIKLLQGLEAVIKRPAMYIGSTSESGLHHLVWEILDNSLDEASNGYADTIKVNLIDVNTIEIIDNGRGIPVGVNKKYKKRGIELVFENLHAGGKFDSNSYKTSGGLHGVGASVVNALSSYLDITVWIDGYEYNLKYSKNGKSLQKLKKIKATTKKGTRILFQPDKTIFKDCIFNAKLISDKIQEEAFLNSKISFIFNNLITDEKITYKYENGLYDFIELLKRNDTFVVNPISFSDKIDDIKMNLIFAFLESDRHNISSFVNNIKTIDGGTHETGFKTAYTKTINNYAIKNNLIKVRNRFRGNDLLDGMLLIISCNIPESLIEFEGQTKTRLGTKKARLAFEKLIYKHLDQFLLQNRKIALQIIERALLSKKIREAIKSTKDNIKKKIAFVQNKSVLAGKLVHCYSRKAADCELFLVEGNSASGTAKAARERKYQAILPLRGKVLNTLKAKESDVLKNIEINTIVNALNCGIGNSINLETLRYHKVIIMTDADTDGSHIQVLLLTFFWKFLSLLVTEGHVFLALPPLYRGHYKSKNKTKSKYFWSDKEFETAKIKTKFYNIQRYKGLGEMNSDQLKETTMDINKRRLVKVIAKEPINIDSEFDILMGSNIEKRKQWIAKNIDFMIEN